MMSGLVPLLLCPLLQGPCVGPLRSETNFLRRTPSTWRTGTNTLISPGSRQPCWRSSCHSFKRALARASSDVTWVLPSRTTQVSSHQMGGCPPSAGPTRFPPVPAPWQPIVSDLKLFGFRIVPLRLQDPRLNWVPGAPPDGHPSVTYIQQLRLAFSNQLRQTSTG